MVSEIVDDLEFFLELATDEIEQRDQLILELVRKLAAIGQTGAVSADATLRGHLGDLQDLISKARKMVGCELPSHSDSPRSLTGLPFVPDP